MQRNIYVDINKSIQSGNLTTISKRGIFEYFELLFTLVIFGNLSLAIVFLIEIELKIKKAPDQIFGILLFIPLMLALFGAYRKIVERKLSYIQHGLTKTNIRKIILNHLNLDKSSIIDVDDLLMGNKTYSYYHIEYTFIIKKDKIYFNITNQFPKINPPVFFGHLFLKRDLEKLIRQAEPNKNYNPKNTF
jgi:hypothetical protein